MQTVSDLINTLDFMGFGCLGGWASGTPLESLQSLRFKARDPSPPPVPEDWSPVQERLNACRVHVTFHVGQGRILGQTVLGGITLIKQ